MESFKLKQYLKKSWWKYAIPIFITPFLLSYAFDLKDKPKDEEELQIFIACDTFIDNSPIKKASEYLKDVGIRELNTYFYSQESPNYETMFRLQGVLYSDIFIAPLKDMGSFSSYAKDGLFLSLNETRLEYSDELEKLTNDDGDVLALKIYDPNAEEYNKITSFPSWLNFENVSKPLYIAISADRPNIKENEHDETIWLFNYLMGYVYEKA